ncbi:hypothetical protein ACFU6S_44235 [Streptomyces sp. NPDC057456]|uniref:hypothetical protein n=1 Tax=Streptomyces sp. NPDC057456 TaxID=3346139 RepID=UPI0036ADC4B0
MGGRRTVETVRVLPPCASTVVADALLALKDAAERDDIDPAQFDAVILNIDQVPACDALGSPARREAIRSSPPSADTASPLSLSETYLCHFKT